jgi:hypothetical protein|tara:strand:- start:106 stop:276 length:171 start_codon:yes stop_codon:yes gene_type:complete
MDLEKFDKETGKWVSVSLKDADEEVMGVYDIMKAQMEIETIKEEMKLTQDVKERNR